MRNALKKMVGLGAAVLAVVVAAGACQASVYINLSMTADTVAKTWAVYATLTDASGETLGLHGIGIDVWGSQGALPYGAWTGGLAVNDGTDPLGEIVLPSGVTPTFPATPKAAWNIGFTEQTRPGAVVGTGIELMGAMQPSTHRQRAIGTVTYNNILKGVGETAGTAPAAVTIEWDHPVLVAEGMYTGDVGWLNVSVRKDDGLIEPWRIGQASSVSVLPASLPAPSAGGVDIIPPPFIPMAGTDYRASVYVPEPATLALLSLGGLSLLLRRKRR